MSRKKVSFNEDIIKTKTIAKGRQQQKEKNFIKSITQFDYNEDMDVVCFQKTRNNKRAFL